MTETNDTANNQHVLCMLEHLHPCDVGLWARMIPVAFEAARLHKLPLQRMTPDSTGRRPFSRDGCQEHTGWCHVEAGHITICLRFKSAHSGVWMAGARPEADVWRTLAHELCHLECTLHNARFWTMMSAIEETIRTIRSNRPAQRALPRGTAIALGPANIEL